MDERSRDGAGDVTDLPNLPDTEPHVEGAASALCHFPLASLPLHLHGRLPGWLGRGGGKGGKGEILAGGVSHTREFVVTANRSELPCGF